MKDRTLESQTTLSAQYTADGKRIQKSDPYRPGGIREQGEQLRAGYPWTGWEDERG